MHFQKICVASLLLVSTLSTIAAEQKPLRALLLTGGCCHDYGKQKDLLKQGLEARANIVVDQIHTDDKSTKPPLSIHGNPDYAKGYDVVIHDECAADVKDPAVIAAVLAPHRKGIPAVNLHCAMHSYRIGNPGTRTQPGEERAAWFEFLGIQSSSHGPQEPIAIEFLDKEHPITKPLTNWTTIKEELYNNVQVISGATPLARGLQTVKQRDGSTKEATAVVAWVNEYQKTRVFSTTLGHNNGTVSDPRYLDLLTRGLLWSCGKLDQGYLKAVSN